MINSRSLDDLRPDVAANCRVWLARCAARRLNVLVTQTLRDNEYQAALYARGRTKPGSIVTNAKTTSFHGRGLAFDFCRNVRGREYDDPGFFREAAALAKELGFSWGGDWRSFVDRPHIQWDDGGRFSDAMVRAGRLPPAMPLCKTKEGENDMVRYNTIDEIRVGAPWAAPTVEKLLNKDILTGGDKGLDLSADMLRLLVLNDRAGVYDG